MSAGAKSHTWQYVAHFDLVRTSPRNQHAYCTAATILLSKLPTTAEVWITARKSRMRADGRVVLNNLSEQIRECLQHAEDCARKAAELPNSSRFRQDFLQLEKRWLELARSIEFGERLDSFTKNNPKPNIMPNGNAFHLQ